MVKKVEISMKEAEAMMAELKEIEEKVDTLIEDVEKTNVDMAVEMYKYGVMFARFAVLNDVPFEHFIKTSVLMYDRMGGKLEIEEDKVTDSHSVPDKEKSKWLH